MPKEKRPTEKMIWDGKPEEIEMWLDRVFSKKQEQAEVIFNIDEDEIG